MTKNIGTVESGKLRALIGSESSLRMTFFRNSASRMGNLTAGGKNIVSALFRVVGAKSFLPCIGGREHFALNGIVRNQSNFVTSGGSMGFRNFYFLFFNLQFLKL
jgi:hypothetical protein